MYKNQFMNLIKRELPRAVLLFGDDNFYIDRIIDFYIKRTNSQNSVLKYYFDEYNFDSIKNNLSQSSLFGDTNFIIIKRDKRVSKTEIEKLIDLTLKSDNNYLIFHFLGGYLDIKPLLKSFDIDNRAIWVRFFKPTNNEIISILEEKARKLNKFISRENLTKLITILDGDIDLMVKEIEKLSLLDRAVKAEDIDRLVYSTTPIFIDKFLVKLFRKDNIIYPLKKLLEFGEDEFSIVRSTQNFLNQINLFKLYMDNNRIVSSQDILGYRLPANIERDRLEISSLLSFEKLSNLFELLIDIELKLKHSSTINREALLFVGFIRFQRVI